MRSLNTHTREGGLSVKDRFGSVRSFQKCQPEQKSKFSFGDDALSIEMQNLVHVPHITQERADRFAQDNRLETAVRGTNPIAARAPACHAQRRRLESLGRLG
jgi:hypothetical protein